MSVLFESRVFKQTYEDCTIRFLLSCVILLCQIRKECQMRALLNCKFSVNGGNSAEPWYMSRNCLVWSALFKFLLGMMSTNASWLQDFRDQAPLSRRTYGLRSPRFVCVLSSDWLSIRLFTIDRHRTYVEWACCTKGSLLICSTHDVLPRGKHSDRSKELRSADAVLGS